MHLPSDGEDPLTPAADEPIEATALIEQFHRLPPWRGESDFDDEDWRQFASVARLCQRADPEVVIDALDRFIGEAVDLDEEYQGYETESKVFILMRVMFRLPERVSADRGFSFKGWSNWPPPDSEGMVDAGWPVTLTPDGLRLSASYSGSMGQQYAASAEYRFLLENFPYRKLEGQRD